MKKWIFLVFIISFIGIVYWQHQNKKKLDNLELKDSPPKQLDKLAPKTKDLGQKSSATHQLSGAVKVKTAKQSAPSPNYQASEDLSLANHPYIIEQNDLDPKITSITRAITEQNNAQILSINIPAKKFDPLSWDQDPTTLHVSEAGPQ